MRLIRANPLLSAAIAAGLVARIVFWAMTDRRIDDALITVKHAMNAVDGHGLVHHLGEGHVHGFTSALSVLVPLPGELISSEDGGFLVLRLVSLAMFVVAAIYGNRICRVLELGPWPTALVLVYLALDQNQIFFGMAGMETQIAVGVLLASVYYVLVEDFTRSGIWLGLAVLARPDFLLWVIPALVFLLIRSRDGAARSWLIAAAIVAPWVIFTTAYYGSPVPHTIVAKSADSAFFAPHFPPLTDVGGWFDFIGDQVSAAGHDWIQLAPFLERFFVASAPLPDTLLKVIAYVVLALAAVGAVATWRRASWRPAIVYVTLFILYRIFAVGGGYNEWYGPPAIALIFVLAAAGLQWLTRNAGTWAVAVPATALALVFAMHIPFTFPLERTVQQDIEDQVRLPMGRYLGEVVEPGQTIGSESAGYVSWYTNATLYDFPGLTSPTVVDALEDPAPHQIGIYGIAQLLHPDWLILRPNELEAMKQSDPQTASMYRPVRTFTAPSSTDELSQWGLDLFNIDRSFVVLRRVES